jgi:hypothetical protein
MPECIILSFAAFSTLINILLRFIAYLQLKSR